MTILQVPTATRSPARLRASARSRTGRSPDPSPCRSPRLPRTGSRRAAPAPPPPSGGSYGKPLRPNAPLDYRFFDGRLYAPYLVGLEEGSETPLAVADMLEAVRIGTGGQGSPLFDGVQSLFMRSPLAEDDERRRT